MSAPDSSAIAMYRLGDENGWPPVGRPALVVIGSIEAEALLLCHAKIVALLIASVMTLVIFMVAPATAVIAYRRHDASGQAHQDHGAQNAANTESVRHDLQFLVDLMARHPTR
jgi:hypothetical protein